MDLNFKIIVVSICSIAISVAQYNENPQPLPQQYHRQISNTPPINYAPKQIQYPSFSDFKKPSTPLPLILSHRQSLTHDGGFKYAFTADNGLQQGETIAPDGARQGHYSYVDQAGKTITVKYSAGKEGFRILEGAHVPQPAQPQPQPQPQHQPEPQLKYSPPPQQIFQTYKQPESPPFRYNAGPQIFSASNDKYTQVYQQPRPQLQPQIQHQQQPIFNQIPVPRYVQYKNEEKRGNENVIQQEPEYNDEPGKPYSFGNGYSFEFSG